MHEKGANIPTFPKHLAAAPRKSAEYKGGSKCTSPAHTLPPMYITLLYSTYLSQRHD
ncbi:hypothetical protein CLOSTASPAR_04089 [[Clostridium] asparagiforme DSM 15981]|uniref:Uncharacterized protein n=1 Tax=[Clostridium] asparagiforme DSM 15981 TaxID=518636 RepID=C0D495_9FIRM|nr:hypothetical protein CLOSTASPAR_04089 [[Clostridium] asparagiforme DSM 15981]